MKVLKSVLLVVSLGFAILMYLFIIAVLFPSTVPKTPMEILKFLGAIMVFVLLLGTLYGIWLDYILPKIDRYFLAKKLK